MSSGGQPYDVILRISLEEAEQQLEGFIRRIQERFVIRPQIEDPGAPGTTAAPGSSTFGGQQGGGNPSAWRSQDPVRTSPNRQGGIPEPRIGNVPFSQLPPHLQQAIAAQDPTTQQWLAQQANPPMSPADIRQAERFHQWNIRNQNYQTAQNVKAENRQEKDESYYARQQNQEARAADRQRVAQENRQHRDESFIDRRDFGDYRRGERERVRSENLQHRDESYIDRRDFADFRRGERARLAGENRQARDEAAYDSDVLRQEQRTFRADRAGRSPSRQLRMVRDRLATLDPNTSEYQALRAEEANLANRTGLNRTIAPNHLYMQAMFAAFDVASTVTAMGKANAQANAANTVQGRLEAQAQAVSGGGGIISSILKGAWDIAGMWIPGLDSPGLLEKDVLMQGARSELQQQFRQTNLETRTSAIGRRGAAGSYANQYARAEANNVNANAVVDAKIEELTNLINLSDDAGLNTARKQQVKALQGQKRENDAVFAWEEHNIFYQEKDERQSIKDRGMEFRAYAGGSLYQETIESDAMKRRHALETTQAKRKWFQTPGALTDLAETQAAELAALHAAFGRSDAGAIAGLAGSSAANNALLAGDHEGAIKSSIKGALDATLLGGRTPLPAGVQSELKKNAQSSEDLQLKQFRDQRYLQNMEATGARDSARMVASGLQFTSRANDIERTGDLAATAAALAHRPEMALIAQQTALANLQTLKRQMRIAQYTEGSTQQIESGTMGPGGTSTLPRELEAETIAAGLDKVETAIGRVEAAISNLGGD